MRNCQLLSKDSAPWSRFRCDTATIFERFKYLHRVDVEVSNHIYLIFVRFGVLVTWDVLQCSLVAGTNVSEEITISVFRIRLLLYGVTPQKIVFLIFVGFERFSQRWL